MTWSGEVQFTIVDGQAGLYSGPANSVQCVIGCCTGGTVNQIVPTRSTDTLTSTLGYGPLVEACGLVLQAGGTVLAIKAPTATAGAINGTSATGIGSITGATNATPIVITVTDTSTLTTGSVVTISGVGGNTAANGTFPIIVLSATTFSIPVAGSGVYTSGGTVAVKGAVVGGTSGSGTGFQGTAAPFFTGTPNDTYYVMVVCQTGFTVGTTGGTILVSLDAGRNFGLPIAVGTATTIALKDVGGLDTGLTLNLGGSGKTWAGGGVVNGAAVGDYVRASTSGPEPNAAGITSALDSLMAYLAGTSTAFPLVQVVMSTAAASDATTINTALADMATDYTFVRGIISSRDAHPPAAWGGQSPETEATWQASVIADFAATTAVRICTTAGYYNMPTAFPTQFAGAPSYRRPLSFALGARQVTIAPQRHAGKVGGAQGGSITQIVVSPTRDQSDGFIYHNEAINPAFDYFLPGAVGRFAAARTHARKPGFFFADPLTLAAAGSSFTLLPRAIVIDNACDAAYFALIEFEAADLITNANGTLSDASAATVRAAIGQALDQMKGASQISGYTVVVDQTQNIQVTQTLVATITILGVAYVLQSNVTIGYANTLAATPATP